MLKHSESDKWGRINRVFRNSSRNLFCTLCSFCADLVLTALHSFSPMQCVQSLPPTSHDVLFCCREPRGDELVSHIKAHHCTYFSKGAFWKCIVLFFFVFFWQMWVESSFYLFIYLFLFQMVEQARASLHSVWAGGTKPCSWWAPTRTRGRIHKASSC